MSKSSLVFQRTKVKVENLKFQKGFVVCCFLFCFVFGFHRTRTKHSKKYEGKKMVNLALFGNSYVEFLKW